MNPYRRPESRRHINPYDKTERQSTTKKQCTHAPDEQQSKSKCEAKTQATKGTTVEKPANPYARPKSMRHVNPYKNDRLQYLAPKSSESKSNSGSSSTSKGQVNSHDSHRIMLNKFRMVGYNLRGKSNHPAGLVKAFIKIEKLCDIPVDFESNLKYGPHSGTSYEERVVTAYGLNLLKPRSGLHKTKICSNCGGNGHTRDDCNDLLLDI